jgi:hypothetical protein
MAYAVAWMVGLNMKTYIIDGIKCGFDADALAMAYADDRHLPLKLGISRQMMWKYINGASSPSLWRIPLFQRYAPNSLVTLES